MPSCGLEVNLKYWFLDLIVGMASFHNIYLYNLLSLVFVELERICTVCVFIKKSPTIKQRRKILLFVLILNHIKGSCGELKGFP